MKINGLLIIDKHNYLNIKKNNTHIYYQQVDIFSNNKTGIPSAKSDPAIIRM